MLQHLLAFYTSVVVVVFVLVGGAILYCAIAHVLYVIGRP
ncbi:hypothetical protein ANO14919_043020 [Xylariales sp. No.14919]|nr:hypothetical protein ANO14919_043020 [Xylariales sp. No.14919]